LSKETLQPTCNTLASGSRPAGRRVACARARGPTAGPPLPTSRAPRRPARPKTRPPLPNGGERIPSINARASGNHVGRCGFFFFFFFFFLNLRICQ
jgi:hypothetical protein